MSNLSNLKIEGMTCGHCVRAATEALENLSGVQSARVDLASGEASVVHDGTVGFDAMKTAIEEEGYSASLR
ncbi:MAG: cation transporter [Fimbriimonas sp.]